VQSEPTHNEKRCTAFDLPYRIGKINALQREFFHTVIRHVSSTTLKFAKAIGLIKVHYCMAKLQYFRICSRINEVADFC